MTATRLMGLGLIQVIQDRFVQTSIACSGRLGSGTRPQPRTPRADGKNPKEEQKHSSAAAAAECAEPVERLCDA